MDDNKDSNRASVMKETTAGIEWKGMMDNLIEGGVRGGGGGSSWWRKYR